MQFLGTSQPWQQGERPNVAFMPVGAAGGATLRVWQPTYQFVTTRCRSLIIEVTSMPRSEFVFSHVLTSLTLILAAYLALSPAARLHAQNAYPDRPIRLIVPFPPGGGIDVAARIIGQDLSESLGQPVVVDNRAGAGGVIGTEAGARAAADGYNLTACTPGPISISAATNSKLSYNPVTDFAPVSMLAIGANVLVVNPLSPVKSVTDLIELAKQRQGGLNFASSGVGTSQHLSGELLKLLAKVNFVHVPYKGTGAALDDLMAGRVDFSFADPSVLALVKSGQLRALAVTTASRYAAAPDIPTVAESGVNGFEATNWYCMLARAATPKPIIERLNAEVVKILARPAIKAKLLEQNIEAFSSTPEELGAYMRKDIARWTAVANAAGLKVE
jgi:tripartite-type tricarboxylate transporter receptor subunit TctC